MVWVIVFIIVVGLIIEGGKPSSRERQPRRESPDRGAKDKELQEILNRARERKIREKARRQVAEKREAERVDRLFAELENLPQNQEQAKADLEWDSQVSLSAESAGSAATNIDGEAHVVSAAPSLLAKEFERWGINSLWHMTHIRNVPSIMRNGLLAHQSPKLQLMNPVDISDPDVQRWRTKVDPHFSRSLHEYVPLYINPRNPMLFRRREMQREICFIEISVAALEGKAFIFSDGNAASHRTQFYNDVPDLRLLPWDVLQSSFWTDFDDGKRKACSEVLVPDIVEPHFIRAVHCFSAAESGILAQKGIRSVISMDKYFR